MDTHRRKLHSQPSSIVNQLRKAMKVSGLTQYRIAKDSGVPQPVVNRFVTKERGLTLESAAKLCSLLRLRLARYRWPIQ